MDQNPLVIVQEGARFLAEFQKHYAVQVAFWVKESDKEDWYLYIAASDITDDNFDIAYGKVLDVVQELGEPRFDPFQVKLIGVDEPLARAALELRKRIPSQSTIGFQGGTFGGLSVDGVFVYWLPVPSPAST